MRKRIIDLYLACIGNERGKFLSLFRSLFFILSLFYLLAIKIRWLIYKYGLIRQFQLPGTIISVGNTTWGGTGKTPAVIMIAKQLQEMGKRVAVLSRGYRRKKRKGEMSIVSDGSRVILSAQQAGDEPYLLARNLPEVPVIVGKNRVRSGKYALEKFASEVLILDDGFQYWPLKKDLEILTIDSSNPYGNGYLIPRGQLREPISHLSRGEIFLLTRTDLVSRNVLDTLITELHSLNPEALILETVHQPKCLENLLSGEKKGLDFIENRKVVGFSSIGNPYFFEKTLENLSAKIVKIFQFPDHHYYSRRDLLKIEETCRSGREKGEAILITTEKDGVQLKGVVSPEIEGILRDIWVLKVELEISQREEAWRRKIEQYI